METKRTLRIVVASPCDVQRERDVLPIVIDELNRGIAAERGLSLELSRWETDSYPGFHPEGPQGLIDPTLRIEDCDVLIGIFWKRFGTPTNDAQSGTEHEIQLAYEAWRPKGSPQIMVYFNQKPYSPKSKEESDQREKVVAFRNRFPREGLFWSYKGKPHFERLVRNHLTQFIRQRFPQSGEVQVLKKDQTVRDLDELLKAYRSHLRNRVSKVYLVGENKPRELEKVFVKLNVIEEYQRPSIHAEFLGFMDIEMRRRGDPFAREDDDDGADGPNVGGDNIKRAVNPDELLRERTQAVITGAPGCGKTTLLRYLALKTLGNQRLPLFLELKTVNEADFEQARNNLAELLFEKAIAAVLHLQATERDQLKDYFFTRLAAGEAAIFLDGLDEVRGTDFFPTLCTAVGGFVGSDYGKNALVISTRPFALQVRLEGLKEMEIAPLNHHQVEEFLRHYYGDDETNRRFLQHLRRHRGLRELCRAPFLVAVMAQLHRGGHQIVENRLELYRQIVLHLAVKLDGEKSLRLSRFHITDPDGTFRLDFLKHLACERLLMGYVNEEEADREAARLVFTGEALLEQAKRFLKGEKRPEINPHLLAADVKATPLLREVGTDVYAFAHLTIQEYLAAVALSQRNDCEKVLSRAYFNPTVAGMEVLPMTLGLVRKPGAMYTVLEGLPESLSFANFRLRARSLPYASHVSRQLLTALTEQLVEIGGECNSDGTPYWDGILRGFSATDSSSMDFIADRVAILLHNEKSSVRWRAVEALGEFSGERAIAALLGALKHKDIGVGYIGVGDIGVGCRAADALGRIGGERAIEALIEALKDFSLDIGMRAAQALGQLGGERAVTALIKELNDSDYYLLTYHAATALATIGGERSFAALLEALNSDNSDLRIGATDGLAQLGGPSAIAALLGALKDEDAYVRVHAAEALGEHGGESAIAALSETLKDDDAEIRARAVEALGRLGGKSAIAALIEVLKNDPEVRQPAAEALGQLGGERAVAALIEGLKNEKSSVRWSAAKALARLGEESAIVPMLEALTDEDAYIRVCAAEALGRRGGERAIAALIEALKHEDWNVRFRAAYALGQVGEERSIVALIEALKDDESNVRRNAAYALGRVGGEKAISPLVETLKDDESYVRMGAASALEALGDELLSSELVKALSGDNDFVRQKAAEVVGYYAQDPNVLDELARIAATDPAEDVKKAASEARVKYECKMRLFGLLKE